MIKEKILFDAIKTLLIKANTVLDKSVFDCIKRNTCHYEERGDEVIQKNLGMRDQVSMDCVAIALNDTDSLDCRDDFQSPRNDERCHYVERTCAEVQESMTEPLLARLTAKTKPQSGEAVHNKIEFILQNAYLAKNASRPLCQDTGQVLVFLKLPYSFNFGYDFKAVINRAVEETYEQEFYRKSTVKNAVFDRTNTKNNTPAIIYTDFEDRKSVKIDVLVKGGGAENMSFVEMFNPTASHDEIIKTLSQKINERAKNACPPLFIGIGAGGTMDYAALLSKKALFEGIEDEFCEKLKECCNYTSCERCHCDLQALTVLSVKMLSTSTHIASLPVAVTINCHSNRHAGCEFDENGVIYDFTDYEIEPQKIRLENYKKVNTANIEEIKDLKSGEKILLSGTIYTMRDAAHKKYFELMEKGEVLPFEIKNSVIFYAGPAPKKDDEIIGPIGPTTAKRMDKYAPFLYDLGCLATIGKGERSQKVKDSCQKNKAHYLSAIGGIACYLQKSFKKEEVIAFKELGTEAVRKFEIEDLPLLVEI
ncbi:fumarate hydratase [bacterium]|nr:fumarate hydratase [bacterium]